MSGSPTNIQRDGRFVTPQTSEDVAWSSQTAIALAAGYLVANAKTTVYEDVGNCNASLDTVTVSAGNQECIGVYMDPPEGDNTPYRVKASASVIGNPDIDYCIVVGYGPASITGSDDIIDDPYYLPFQQEFDDLIIVTPQDVADPLLGRSIFFGIALQAGTALTTQNARGSISVQRLATKPPTMVNAVS